MTVADGIRAVAVAEAVMAACVGRTWVDVNTVARPRRPTTVDEEIGASDV